jgi:hypothetical protein
MEGGSRFVEWLTYGIIAIVLFAMVYFLARTLKLTMGFLSLPLSDVLQRWRFTRRWFERRTDRHGDDGIPPRGD